MGAQMASGTLPKPVILRRRALISGLPEISTIQRALEG